MLEVVKVPMPKKRIIKERRNGKTYVFYVLKTYRNEKGQPTNERISIGKLDEKTGLLIPNDSFFKYYDCKISVDFIGEKNEK